LKGCAVAANLNAPLAVFDLDALVMRASGRERTMFDHRPNEHGVKLMKAVLACNQYEVHVWSGRGEDSRKSCQEWLFKHGLCDYVRLRLRPLGYMLREEHLKERWLKEEEAQGRGIAMVFESGVRISRMFQRHNILTFHVSAP
jgi:hypothetical protein